MVRFTKYMLGMAAITMVFTIMLAAQPGGRMTPQERVDKMTKDLALTKDQQAKVLDILTTSQVNMKKIRDENTGDREAMRPAMQKIRQESEEQLKKVLTPEQFEKMKAQLREAGAGRQRRGNE